MRLYQLFLSLRSLFGRTYRKTRVFFGLSYFSRRERRELASFGAALERPANYVSLADRYSITTKEEEQQ